MAKCSMVCLGRQVAALHSWHDFIVYDRPLAVATFQGLFDKRGERISPKALKTSSPPTATCWRKGGVAFGPLTDLGLQKPVCTSFIVKSSTNPFWLL